MEGDGHAGGNRRRHRDISIHSLRMEGDYWQSDEGRVRLKFQSTPSAWRET